MKPMTCSICKRKMIPDKIVEGAWYCPNCMIADCRTDFDKPNTLVQRAFRWVKDRVDTLR